ncbi:MAG: hypothetical protein ACJA1A_002826 [Saprospiraceae bacterium]|jgi:hypothetical protein|tara:strand:- start:23 stop:1021 length:999 start_codon:yes stop_codon:yes gene_type:complete
MSVIMGGSGSTGSSLVKNILNRHSDIFTGEETSFFAKKLIYDDWLRAKNSITKRKLKGLKNLGYHIYNGTDLVQSEYGHSKTEIEVLANESDTLLDFCASFYKQGLTNCGAKFWLEKTPANSACFTLFLDHFHTGKVIHMLRNPYDTIASLWSRGYDLHYAVGIYLLNTSNGLLANRYSGRYHEIKYEDIVQNPSVTIADVCTFLDVEYNLEMLISKDEKIEVSQLTGWNYDETANIGTEALGRFERLSAEKRLQILEAVDLIKVSDAGKKYYNIEYSSIREVCGAIDYEYYEIESSVTYSDLKRKIKKDRFERLKRGYATGIHYPLVLAKK